jgi:hypothetical protein
VEDTELTISDEKKQDILLALLKERYEASHKMRDRSYNFVIWIMGFGIALIWLILSRPDICSNQRVVLTVLVIVSGILAFFFLHSIDRGFTTNKAVMVKLEQILGCYEKGQFKENEAIYPLEYESLKKNPFSHFLSLYLLLATFGLGIIALLWWN